jgi:sulfur relay (sulfurtransferase) complex TusBCD TusD component (DsrE family)
MASYILIESRDPFDSADVGNFRALAEGLAREGSEVVLFLVQNAVLAARRGVRSDDPRVPTLVALASNGIKVLADSFCLEERGISPDHLVDGISAAPLSVVVDCLAAGHRALWH